MEMKMDIGMVGLAVMGRSLALNMADNGFQVGAYNRSSAVTEQVMRDHPHENLHPYYSLIDLVSALKRPRRVMLMIQAGKAVDAVIEQLIPLLDDGDMILDGGNSFFEDTRRRADYLAQRGIHYLGVGISGGEEGARRGPSIMPGGNPAAYEAVRPILEAISAKAEGQPCCAYIGPEGAGHYVKMVHNGIEYADMQLIAESYLLLKYVGGLTNAELAQVYAAWDAGELRSYLIGITARILREQDDLTAGELVDHILDSASQKGTGRWASIEALKQGVDISMITTAANARVMSNDLARREQAYRLIERPTGKNPLERAALIETVRQALYTGKIIAYAQGFALLRDASERYGWNLHFGEIASIFRAGCIIQAAFLNDITDAFCKQPALSSLLFDEFFLSRVNKYQSSLRVAATLGVSAGLPLPATLAAVSYLDSFRARAAGANLIQAQRDFFGAHTYQRIDREGIYHHEWSEKA